LLQRRSFADQPAGRPKAHTGRAPARKTPKKSASTDTKAVDAKGKPTIARKTVTGKTKAEPRSKPKLKAKPTPKPKSRKRKRALTEKGKIVKEKTDAAAKRRLLKATALTPPKNLPASAWTVFLREGVHENLPLSGTGPFGAKVTELAAHYKAMPASEREVRVLFEYS